MPSSARAQTTATSATEPFVIQVFSPERIQSPPSRFARFGPHISVVVIALAVGLMLFGLFGGGSTKVHLIALGVGAVGVFIGVPQGPILPQAQGTSLCRRTRR